MSKKNLYLTILAFICIIAGLVQATPLKRDGSATETKLTFTDVRSKELTAIFEWHFGAVATSTILMNMAVEFHTDKYDITCYEFQILDCDGKLAFDPTKDIIAGNVCKGNFVFFTEQFIGIEKPADLENYTLVIRRDNHEIGRSRIS
ncbi:hypothetical protein F8M41_017147 [Gigaspora margarita]|uniref:Uncharacterized protein n=1 Tax=Gigaspora margarita TaxID=4874 RepID=A0A8H4EM87_GIGMA|nr:hypothetical protein F8M41_017147 [Gigaspora margarita]